MKKKTKILTAIIFLIVIILILAIYQYLYLKKAHSTFENYYAFRGCVQLIERTDEYGICKIGNGEIIKIVKYQDKWFLDGDLPFVAKLPVTASSTEVVLGTQIEYKNDDFGFTFTLPLSWQGYSILNNKWEGNLIDGTSSEKISGPEIFIRHPLWTSDNPRQDIPIMVFTLSQWNLVQQEKLALGAASIPPTELGRNSKYVFALPARYNFAFQTGFEEVEKIIENKPIKTFNL